MKRSEERLEAHRWLDRAAPQAMLDRHLTGEPDHAVAVYRSMNANEG